MENILCNSWEDFLQKIHILETQYTEETENNLKRLYPLLFRGQSQSDWNLETTLERFLKKINQSSSSDYKADDYYEIVYRTNYPIESFTKTKWDIPSVEDWKSHFNNNQNWRGLLTQGSGLPGYNYLAYLRHHGFPSPLLDWSRSPYVAAYFAFYDSGNSQNVSIYAYCGHEGGRDLQPEEPSIQVCSELTHTHERHYNQQSQYTICTKRVELWIGGIQSYKIYFTRHDSPNTNYEDSFLKKYEIPSSEKGKVLKYLDRHNLNSFSLFSTEESLMQTLAIREFKNAATREKIKMNRLGNAVQTTR